MVKKNRNKRIVSLIVLLIVLISITIGYSALSSTLNIKGTTNITKPTWNIHFENLVVNSAWNTTTTTVQTAPTIDSSGLKITYAVTLANPGDFYEFTVDVKNAGTVAAKLNAVPTVSGVSSAQSVYINYSVTYDNGNAPAQYDEIAAGGSRKFKVHVDFKRDIYATQLPTANQSMTLTVGMNYVQK